MATRTPSTRSRSTTAKRTPRKRSSSTASVSRAQALTDDAKTAVRSVRTRATRAAKKVPTDTRSLSIALGVIAGIGAAAVAIFMNRDKLRDVASTSSAKLRDAASTGGEKLKKAADDLSTMAHERIDQARDNITKFRGRDASTADNANRTAAEDMAITG
ncbi:MAG: hypothetical protein EOP61_18705 [Sphingomonadales bacterium]|nr:MAG: hypothetical protein EOP61_18705 [Sphingomonadales bacterium]